MLATNDRALEVDTFGMVTDAITCVSASPSPTRTRTISTSAIVCNVFNLRYGSSPSNACNASSSTYYIPGSFSTGNPVYNNITCTNHASSGYYSNGFTYFYKSSTGNLINGNICRSDRRLKKNINLIGKSPSGINIYSFEYIDSKLGKGVYQGVMAQEVPHATVLNPDGYLSVEYAAIDVEFKEIK